MPEQMMLPTSAPSDPRVLVFDLETLRSAGEVGGWNNIHRMGMACGVVYDSLDKVFRVYQEPEVNELLKDLQKADLVVGFNHVRFDYRVLSAYTPFRFEALPSFDLLEDITAILGHRLKLDSLAGTTLGEKKSADGLQSLRWVKEGRLDLVCDYCKQDVDVTRKLFEYGAREGKVMFENFGKVVEVPVNWKLDRLLEDARRRRLRTT